ncbi:zinc/iron-chelating domain-containing protein [Halobacteriales archaeon SW_12_71_31]|nr:MAG: zinc/iron-chelating domain-containing protein [Halobacteriales archaeon SW_12_71_31]
MQRLEDELERARSLDVDDLADAIETVGFECTRCGACCKGHEPEDAGDADADGSGEREPHTATVFPDEVRQVRDGLNERASDDDGQPYDWRDVARPTPFGLREGPDGPTGETFEWALAVDDCGDCAFYDEAGDEGTCTAYGDRPLVCRTYPFSVALGGVDEPMGEVVDGEGMVRAHECEGLGRDISREDAEALAATLKERAVREIEEAIAVRESYAPVETDERVVVHDSEGAKRPDGSLLD